MDKNVEKLTGSIDPKVHLVLDKYRKSKDHYGKFKEKFSKWDDMYFNIPNPKKYDWMSNLVVPATHRAVMTLLSRIINFTTAADPFFDTVPSNKYVSNLIRSQLFRGNFHSEYVLFCLQLLIRGTSIGRISWQKKTETKFTLEKVVENIKKSIVDNDTGDIQEVIQQVFKGYKKKPKDKVLYDGPVFETIDLNDFYPDPIAVGMNKGARIFRSIVTKDEFMRNPNFINKDIAFISEYTGDESSAHSRLRTLGVGEPSYGPAEHMPDDDSKKRSDYIELLECEMNYPDETGKLVPWIFTIANKSVLVRDEAFPYWNTNSLYVKGTWIPILNEFYGIGLCELSESLQEELNDKRNQRIDNVNQVLQPVLMYEETAVDGKYFHNFKRKPGAKMRTRPGAVSANAIRWDVLPDVTTSAITEAMDLERNIEELTGAVKAIQPSSSGPDSIHRTSSGLMLLQGMAHERIKLNLGLIEKDVLEPIVNKFFDLNLQFLTKDYKIFDPDGKAQIYDPSLLIGDYEFRAKGSKHALDQQQKMMNATRVLEALGASGLPLGELHIKFWMRLYDAMGFEDKDEIEKILRQEIARFQQQQAQLAQAQAQAKGGGNPDAGNQIREMTGQAMGMDAVRSGAGQMIPGGGL